MPDQVPGFVKKLPNQELLNYVKAWAWSSMHAGLAGDDAIKAVTQALAC